MRPETEQELAHLLLVELLAYQFASPVRWIETQDVILNDYKAERLVEIGPSPTLSGMAMRTIKAKYETHDAALNLQRQVFCYSKDAKEIYYTPDPAAIEPPASDAPKEDPAAAAAASAAVMDAAAAAHIPPPSASAGPAQAIPDEPVTALDLIRGLIAQKLKKPLDQVPVQKAIKDLVGGKSTLQNEILGDLGKEFGATPEKPEETPIDELAAQFQVAFNGQLGKHSTSLIQRMISSKMPGGFNLSAVRKYLNERWGLGAGRQDAILILALTEEPNARLTAEGDAKSFFDTLANKYAATAGISLASAASGGAGGGAGAGGAVAIDAAALEKITGGQNQLVERQLELFAKYLQIDLRKGDKAFVDQQAASQVLQDQLDLWLAEHGDFYASGITPCFSRLKARVYDSSWNWARQDALSMFFDIVFGRLNVIDREIVSQCILIMNRSTPQLVDFMQYHIDHCPEKKGSTYALAKQLGYQLIENCKEALSADPVYKNVMYPTGPNTTIDPKGTLKYEELPRPSVRKLEQYVKEMISGYKIPAEESQRTIKDDLAKVYELLKKQPQFAASKSSADFGKIYADIIKTVDSAPSNQSVETIPFLHLKSLVDEKWEYDNGLTELYLDSLEKAAKEGVTYKGKYALVTGAGAGSIGAEILQGLLSGGAKVIVTTSRYSREVTEFYQALYVKYGASGSSLIVVPFNQGSKQDIEKLVEYIYDPKTGLGWDLDIIVPFAAIPENGREIDSIDSKSELAHRIMLTNLLRLLGSIKAEKLERGYTTRPAQVILPLSPNHGTFGSDGLYSESKLGLETLFNRWHSESWGSYLTVCGAIIGWTRGTGLMSANNSIAEGIEKHGVRTFSQQEMAFNILGLMTPAITNLCQTGPVFADLNGGLQFIPKLKDLSSQLRAELLETSEIRRAVSTETALEHKVVNGEDAERFHNKVKVKARANLNIEFPKLKSFEEISHLSSDLKGMVDLEKVIVVTGFSEVGPWGNARTRWDMEAHGKFSLEGCIEMAWIMGLIKHHSGPLKGKPGVAYSGWVDSKTGEPVDDRDVKAKYEKYILEHSGIRLIEPELFKGYNPHKKEFLQEIVVEHDLEPFETSKEGAEDFRRQQGDKAEVFEIEGSDQWSVRLLKGASLFVPKAIQFDRLVAGQIPTGWDARRYGIGEDIISQVDPVTLFVLVSTVETLLASGITDPYEFYKYIHVSELGNCTGSGMGGLNALKSMFKDRFVDKPVQMDILQESFINTMSAWVNMLLLSSSGPIKTPVGACATAVESLDVGCETILTGKARVCFVGGFDDFQEDSSYEFANMKATSNSETEFAHGRTPSEMSRPATTSRDGFMESQGAGTQIIMTAKLALEMGVPIYGILAMTATASDKIGRSVPAPGRGILTTARERRGKLPSPLLDIKYRRRQLDIRRRQIKEWTESEILYVEQEAAAIEGDEEAKKTYLGERLEHLKREAARQERDAVNALGNDFWRKDPEIAPMRGALATWNLTIDDIGVASFHGTSTQANDKNESKTYQSMMEHMGRSKGNVLYCVFQKYLTGHPKGAAGAWMFNGALQMLNTGLVPGNRNADNIDKNFVDFDLLLYPSRSIQTDGVKAVTLTSFGFGQKGAQAIAIHPDYLYATLDQEVYEAYQVKVASRYQKTYRYFHSSLVQNSMFVAKDHPPYAADQEGTVYLDPTARVDNKLSYPHKASKFGPSKETEETVAHLTKQATSGTKAPKNIGVDVESLSSINIDNETFINRNFTPKEIEYCQSAPSPLSSFTGTWSAKEAVFKALGVQSKGAGAALNGIEIVRDAKGVPTVKLHGDAATAATKAGVKDVKVSISHDDFQAIAVAVSDS